MGAAVVRQLQLQRSGVFRRPRLIDPLPPSTPSLLSPHRYKIEQELGTEIKPIPPVIEKGLYCA